MNIQEPPCAVHEDNFKWFIFFLRVVTALTVHSSSSSPLNIQKGNCPPPLPVCYHSTISLLPAEQRHTDMMIGDYTYFAIISVVETTEEESRVWRLLVCFEPPRVGAAFPILVEQTFTLQALLSTCLPTMCSACPSPKPLLHFTAFRLLALRTLNFILQFKIITTHSCIYLIRKNESLCFMW